MNCGVDPRRSWDPELPWLWHRPGSTALIRPLAWEPPYATGSSPRKGKKTKKKKKKPLFLNSPSNVVIEFGQRHQLGKIRGFIILTLGKPNPFSMQHNPCFSNTFSPPLSLPPHDIGWVHWSHLYPTPSAFITQARSQHRLYSQEGDSHSGFWPL